MTTFSSKCIFVASMLFVATGCEEETIDYDADFEASVTAIGIGQYVNFEDASTGGITTREWTFEGGQPSSSTEKDPSSILYTTAGSFDVTLTITTAEGTSTETKEDFIVVEQLEGGCGATTTVTDIDGNTYGVVTIGSQCWMTENLNVSKFRDGSAIPVVTDNAAWQNLESPGMTSYENNNANEATFGNIYNWYAVGDPRGICPDGWRVPHDNDYRTLTDYLDPDGDFSGGRMKKTGTDLWETPNDGANNSSGFSGLPGGMRFREGMFDHMGRRGTFWTIREDGDFEAYFLTLTYDTPIAYRTRIFKQSGFSCRCIKE